MDRDILEELGVGVSWGIGPWRIGRSGYGTWWISVGIPRTGIRFSKVIYRPRRNWNSQIPAATELPTMPEHVELPSNVSQPLTPNQQILKEMEIESTRARST